MTTEEIRKNAKESTYSKDIAYRIIYGEVEYLQSFKGRDGKLSCGYTKDSGWISLETNKPL